MGDVEGEAVGEVEGEVDSDTANAVDSRRLRVGVSADRRTPGRWVGFGWRIVRWRTVAVLCLEL